MLPTKPIVNVTWRDAERHREVSPSRLASCPRLRAHLAGGGQDFRGQKSYTFFQLGVYHGESHPSVCSLAGPARALRLASRPPAGTYARSNPKDSGIVPTSFKDHGRKPSAEAFSAPRAPVSSIRTAFFSFNTPLKISCAPHWEKISL